MGMEPSRAIPVYIPDPEIFSIMLENVLLPDIAWTSADTLLTA